MSERSQQIRVGIIFIFSIVILVAGVLWFKNFKFGGANNKVTVEFTTTSGLVRGDPVEVRGVPSGQVSLIRFEDGRALVTLDLDKNVGLYPDTRFAIENVGIMGQKLVAVYPGQETTAVDPGSRIFKGDYQPGIPEFMSNLEGVLESFNRVTTRLDAILVAFDESDEGSLRRTLKNTEAITNDIAAFTKETQGELAKSVHNFTIAMDDLHRTLTGRDPQIDALLDNAARATARADTALAALQSAASRADSLMARLDRGQGSMGKMMQDETMYHELTATLNETRTLLADIKAHPKKYFKFSLF